MDSKKIKGIPFRVVYCDGFPLITLETEFSKIEILFKNKNWSFHENWKKGRISQEILMFIFNSPEMIAKLADSNGFFDCEISPIKSIYSYQFLNQSLLFTLQNIPKSLQIFNEKAEHNRIQELISFAEERYSYNIERNLVLKEQIFILRILKGINEKNKYSSAQLEDYIKEEIMYNILNSRNNLEIFIHCNEKPDLIFEKLESFFKEYNPLEIKSSEYFCFQNETINYKNNNKIYHIFGKILKSSQKFVWILPTNLKAVQLSKILNWKGKESMNMLFVQSFLGSNLNCYIRENNQYNEFVIEAFSIGKSEKINQILNLIINYFHSLINYIRNKEENEKNVSFLLKNCKTEELIDILEFLTKESFLIIDLNYVQELEKLEIGNNVQICNLSCLKYVENNYKFDFKFKEFSSIEFPNNPKYYQKSNPTIDSIDFDNLKESQFLIEDNFKISFIPNKFDKNFSYFEILIKIGGSKDIRNFIGVQAIIEFFSMNYLEYMNDLNHSGGYFQVMSESLFDIQFKIKVLEARTILAIEDFIKNFNQFLDLEISKENSLFLRKLYIQKLEQRDNTNLFHPSEKIKFVLEDLDYSEENIQNIEKIDFSLLLLEMKNLLNEINSIDILISTNSNRDALKELFTHSFLLSSNSKIENTKENDIKIYSLQDQGTNFIFKIIHCSENIEEIYLTAAAIVLILKNNIEKCLFNDMFNFNNLSNLEKYKNKTIFEFSSSDKIKQDELISNIFTIIENYRTSKIDFDNLKKALIFGVLSDNKKIEEEIEDYMEIIFDQDAFENLRFKSSIHFISETRKSKIIENLSIESLDEFVKKYFST